MKLNINDCEIHFSYDKEYTDPYDHFDLDCFISEHEYNEFIKSIKLSTCDYSQWFCAKIVVSYKSFKSDPEFLGCCSYESFDEFIKSSYYNSMVIRAYENLIIKIKNTKLELKEIEF